MTNLLRAPVLVLLAAVLAACSGDDRASGAREAPTPSPAASQGRGARDAGASGGTAVRITVGDTELRGRLLVNASARDLSAQLPLTLEFRDHNSAEKTAPLPRELSTEDAPAGHDPAAGDIGYYAPGGDLVLYYDHAAPFFEGIIRIGEFEGDVAALEREPDGASITVERSAG
jgi:hypothetical protein